MKLAMPGLVWATLLSFPLTIDAYSMESTTELIRESQLVFCHTTVVFPFPIMRVGGKFNKKVHTNASNEIIEIERHDPILWPPIRVTLHWGLNAAIPAADTVTKVEGKNLPVPAVQRYGVIEPFKELKDQIYGGYIRDFYSIGEHTISENAILFIPRNELEQLRNKISPDFRGQLITYDYQPENGQHAGWAIDTYLKESKFPFLTNAIKMSLYDFSRRYGEPGRKLYDDYIDFQTLTQTLVTRFGKLVTAHNAPATSTSTSVFSWLASLVARERDDIYLEVKHTVGELRGFRQLYFANGINTTEPDFFDYMKSTFAWDLAEPGLYHIESKFCKLEDEIYLALVTGEGHDQLKEKLLILQSEIENRSPKAGAAFALWRERVLDWMDHPRAHLIQ